MLTKLTKLILQTGCSSYQLTSWRKSPVIQKPPAQIHKVFYQPEKTEKTNDLGRNVLKVH